MHPKYLDAKGLVALWREALLAQKVLRGRTKGYRHHPQLERFQRHSDPRAAIGCYLLAVQEEATTRGYRFDKGKIQKSKNVSPILVSTGQIQYELKHLTG